MAEEILKKISLIILMIIFIFDVFHLFYNKYRPHLITIFWLTYYPKTSIVEIAKQKGEDENAVWQKIKRGQFTGEMMHLRDVEKYLGKGVLKKIAHWNERIETPIENVLFQKQNNK